MTQGVAIAARPLVQRRMWALSGKLPLIMVLGFAIVAVIGPFLVPRSPIAQVSGAELLSPAPGMWLGTDHLGRDVLTRLIYGTRQSLLLGTLSVGAGALIGIPLGLLAGYKAGAFEIAIMRPIDALLAIPNILAGIVVATILGPGVATVAITIAIVSAPIFARVTRGAVLNEVGREYVTSARTLGASHLRIVVRHIFPNIVGSLLPQFVLTMAISVVLEASLSFLGLGAQRPAPSWGIMLDDGRGYLQNAPWMVIGPALAVVVLIGALTGLSSSLTRWLSPGDRGN